MTGVYKTWHLRWDAWMGPSYPWNYPIASTGWPNMIGAPDGLDRETFGSSLLPVPSLPGVHWTVRDNMYYYEKARRNDTNNSASIRLIETFPPPLHYQFDFRYPSYVTPYDIIIYYYPWAQAIYGQTLYRLLADYKEDLCYPLIRIDPLKPVGIVAPLAAIGILGLMFFSGATSTAPARRRRTA